MRLDSKTTEELRKMLRDMSPRSTLFKIVKDEMKRRGHFKQLPRGKADIAHFNKKG